MSKENRAYRFRLYPDKKQEEMLIKTFGCVRFIHNIMLSDKRECYEATGENLRTTPAAYKKAYEWLKEVDSLALANAQLNLERAYKNFFENPENGYPKFKSKHRSRMSYTTNVVNGNIRLEDKDRRIRLPKVGKVKIKVHRSIPEEWRLKSVTVTKEPSGKYYASLLFEYERDEKETVKSDRDSIQSIGLDFSMHELYRDSNGDEPEYPRYYRKAEARLKREQRKLSKMKKGSCNRKKQQQKVAKMHEKVANQRKDFLHKESRRIANAYDVVCMEDLDMKGMSQALHFGKSVSDNGWGMFLRFVEYKLDEQGKDLVKVARAYPSSQLCHMCGYRNKKTKNLGIREWTCPVCGAHHDRDWNAAINIRKEGLRIFEDKRMSEAS